MNAPVIVGSGFARADVTCPTCKRWVHKGWEAWVTAWDSGDNRAFHPDCYSWEG